MDAEKKHKDSFITIFSSTVYLKSTVVAYVAKFTFI